jgi:hypothetical protein
MEEKGPSQFYTPASSGDSRIVYKIAIDAQETLQTSRIRARNPQSNSINIPSLTIDGIPGVPFERGIPNPDTFYQGEDIVYDLFLYYEGDYVKAADYDVLVSVKTSPRASSAVWTGSIDNGVYPIPNNEGYFELWIPSTITSTFLAGSYYLDVLLQEQIGRGKGRYDRKYVLVRTAFNIEFSNFSTNAESVTNTTLRQGVVGVWPNTPDTIGRPASTPSLDQHA